MYFVTLGVTLGWVTTVCELISGHARQLVGEQRNTLFYLSFLCHPCGFGVGKAKMRRQPLNSFNTEYFPDHGCMHTNSMCKEILSLTALQCLFYSLHYDWAIAVSQDDAPYCYCCCRPPG